MMFDIRTLLVSVTLAAAFCTAARILLCRLHPTLPGLARWAWAGVMGTTALALVALRGVLPDLLSHTLALPLMVAGSVIAWDGFRRFAGGAPVSRGVYAAFALGALVPTAISLVSHWLVVQLTCNTALLALTSALAARELLQNPTSARKVIRVTGWLLALNAAVFTLRTVAVARGIAPVGPMHTGVISYITLFWWLCATIALTLCMVLMASERLQSDLDQQANRDPLTGALNRRAFMLQAEKEQARARRDGQPLAIVMMDLDHFKKINDLLGHAGGDAVLRHFVDLLGRVLRGHDVFCRFGGEEFLALLPGTDADQALRVAERLRVAFAAEAKTAIARPPRSRCAITVSLGVSAVQADEDLESAIRRADDALYRAKAAGRNRSEGSAPLYPLAATV